MAYVQLPFSSLDVFDGVTTERKSMYHMHIFQG